jgi:transforming growth factor-beta-induced protein
MKTLNKYFSLTAFALAGMLIFSACNKDDDTNVQPENPIEGQKSIAQIASENSNFSILVDALSKAGLVETLQSDGSFTVFAPTNEAFEMLFEDLGVNGLDDLPGSALAPILLYHVIGSEARSSDLSSGYYTSLSTATPDNTGATIFIEAGMGVKINGNVNVTSADLEASNGVIHVIDKVMLPQNVVELAVSNKNFSILVQAVLKAGLAEALSADGPFTVFAPTNTAFEELFAELNVSGIEDLTAEALTPILLYHVVADNVMSSEVSSGSVPTLNGANLTINTGDRGVSINGSSSVIAVDVQGTNGVIHAIDKVLLP